MQNGKWMVMGGGMMLVGMAAGAHVFGAQPAEAQHTSFRECYAGHQETVDIDGHGVVAAPSTGHMVNVPAGWTVVSAGGDGGGSVVVLFCR